MITRYFTIFCLITSPIAVLSQDVAFVISEKDLIPEGITCDAATGTFYISSVMKNKIVRSLNGKVSDFISTDAHEFFGGVGLHVDNRRQVLWACSGNIMGKNFRTGVFAFDLKTGDLNRKFSFPMDTVKRFFNDLAIVANGDVFITDTYGHSIWRYSLSMREPVPMAFLGRGAYPNGIVATADNKFLMVATHGGIRKVSIATGVSNSISTAAGVHLATGLDGIGWFGTSLVGIQNGSPGSAKLVQYFFNSDLTSITASRILDDGNPLFDIPTTLVVYRGYAYVIANSQLDNLDQEKLTIKDPSKLRETSILRYKLKN